MVLSESLLIVFDQADLPARHAAAWALGWLSIGILPARTEPQVWYGIGGEVDQVMQALDVRPRMRVSQSLVNCLSA